MPVLLGNLVHAENVLEQRYFRKEELAFPGDCACNLNLVRKDGDGSDAGLPVRCQVILDTLLIGPLIGHSRILGIFLCLLLCIQGPHHYVAYLDLVSLYDALPEVETHCLTFLSPAGCLQLLCQTYGIRGPFVCCRSRLSEHAVGDVHLLVLVGKEYLGLVDGVFCLVLESDGLVLRRDIHLKRLEEKIRVTVGDSYYPRGIFSCLYCQRVDRFFVNRHLHLYGRFLDMVNPGTCCRLARGQHCGSRKGHDDFLHFLNIFYLCTTIKPDNGQQVLVSGLPFMLIQAEAPVRAGTLLPVLLSYLVRRDDYPLPASDSYDRKILVEDLILGGSPGSLEDIPRRLCLP